MEAVATLQSLGGRLWADESGQDLVEYALLLVLIALVAIAAVELLGTEVSEIFQDAQAGLDQGT